MRICRKKKNVDATTNFSQIRWIPFLIEFKGLINIEDLPTLKLFTTIENHLKLLNVKTLKISDDLFDNIEHHWTLLKSIECH